MYAKVDDRFFTNPKARAAGSDGRALFLAGLCHCSAHLTDGIIRADMLPVIAAEAEVQPSVADRLVTVDMWEPTDTGWLVVNYLEWNQSKEQVETKRAKDAERQAEKRARDAAAQSRATSRRDSSASPHGSPVQTSPSDGKPSSSSVLPAGTVIHSVALDDVLDLVADRRLKTAQAAGTVRSPAGWRKRVRANLADEVGPRLLELVESYDVEPHVLAEVLEGARDTRYLARRNPAGGSGAAHDDEEVAL